MATTRIPSMTRLILELDDDLLGSYERRAKLNGITLEEEITDRLLKCAKHTSPRSLYIPHEALEEIEDSLGGVRCGTVNRLKRAIDSRVTLLVGGNEITIPDDIAERLETRLSDSSEGDSLESVVLGGLRNYVGL